MHRNENENFEYDHLIKCVVVGDKGSGKSSLILRFGDNTYTESSISTMGVDFKTRTIEYKNTTFKMQLWDKSDEEIRGINLRGAQAVVIALDMTKNALEIHQSLEGWINAIDRFADENAIVVIAANKSDNQEQDSNFQVKYNLLQEFYNRYFNASVRKGVLGFVSAKTGENIEDLFTATASVFKKNLDSAPPSAEQKNELLGQLQRLCADNAFWSDKIRFQCTKIPEGVKHINELLSNPDASPDVILKQVKDYAAYKHSSAFQWAHNLFRGRHEATNELYKILSNISIEDIASHKKAVVALNRYTTRYTFKETAQEEKPDFKGVFYK